jgi:hypothetical protein
LKAICQFPVLLYEMVKIIDERTCRAKHGIHRSFSGIHIFYLLNRVADIDICCKFYILKKVKLMKKIYLLMFICLLVLTIKTEAQTYAIDTLDINNVRAVFNSTGINFSEDYNSFFEVPKGSNNKTIGCNTLWVAGTDIHSSLYLSGGTISSTEKDYFPGPLTTDGTASTNAATMAQWNKVWKVTKQEVLYHKIHYGTAGYIMPDGIANWPAHGDTTLHQAYDLAPYNDMNNDGAYTPEHGDYPLICGDEALFFIFNDKGGNHGATGGTPFGIEVHAMAYAFNCPGDSALNNTIFLHYKIINRATYWYSSVALGIYSDISIGYSQNDYIQSDIQKNSFYTYSANTADPIFGSYFPAQATTILSGPLMDPDDTDNPTYDSLNLLTCNDAVNGMNFGDNVIDNERFGMSAFISFSKCGNPIFNEPTTSGHYFGYLKNTWKDGRKLQYGGYGYDYAPPYGPECNFMYPGLSDPCNWGTMGISPYGPQQWTEETAMNSAGDRQGLAIIRPVSIFAGDFIDLDLAFIYGIDYSQPGVLDGWHTVLNQRIDSIRSYFQKDKNPCGGSITGITQNRDNSNDHNFMVFPNPAMDQLMVKFPYDASGNYTCHIYNMQGMVCLSSVVSSSSGVKIDVSKLTPGIYNLLLSNGYNTNRAKFIKL